jgi:hypothetical protein
MHLHEAYSKLLKLRDWLMYQTLVGIGMIVVGSAIVIFSERITRVTAALHQERWENCREVGVVEEPYWREL